MTDICPYQYHYCIAGTPCLKYESPLACATYKELKKTERETLAKRTGQTQIFEET